MPRIARLAVTMVTTNLLQYEAADPQKPNLVGIASDRKIEANTAPGITSHRSPEVAEYQTHGGTRRRDLPALLRINDQEPTRS